MHVPNYRRRHRARKNTRQQPNKATTSIKEYARSLWAAHHLKYIALHRLGCGDKLRAWFHAAIAARIDSHPLHGLKFCIPNLQLFTQGVQLTACLLFFPNSSSATNGAFREVERTLKLTLTKQQRSLSFSNQGHFH